MFAWIVLITFWLCHHPHLPEAVGKKPVKNPCHPLGSDDNDNDYDFDYDDNTNNGSDDDNNNNGHYNDDGNDHTDNDNNNDNNTKWFQDLDLNLNKLSAKDKAWFLDMKHDPIWHACKVVCYLCSSDQRRLDFEGVIVNGNKIGWFKDANGSPIQVHSLEPLHNIRTHWDSTYTMIERLLVLQPVNISAIICFNHGIWVWYSQAIDMYFKLHPNPAVKLTGCDWKLLKSLREVLEVSVYPDSYVASSTHISGSSPNPAHNVWWVNCWCSILCYF